MLSENIAELLKTTREEKGFTIEDVSRAISLRVEVIKNLESGDFTQVGAMVYTKSYLRKYAEFLGLDRNEFEEKLVTLQSDDPLYRDVSENFKANYKLGDNQPRSYIWIYFIILVILLSGAFAFYYYDPLGLLSTQSSPPQLIEDDEENYQTTLSNVENHATSTLNDEDSVIESNDQEKKTLTLLSEEILRENSLLEENQKAEELISQQRENEATVNAQEEVPLFNLKDIPKDTLLIAVKGECWVGIKDKAGKQIANEILTEGTYNFSGEPPYSITVGNARAVETIIINGNEIDEKIYRPTPNTTVKNFSINPKEYERNE